jgi:hypothetical protein
VTAVASYNRTGVTSVTPYFLSEVYTMKREFSLRVFLNRSERNAAQAKLEQLNDIKTLPALIRFALEKLDTDLADEILKLKSEVSEVCLENANLRMALKIAEAARDMHENNATEFSKLHQQLLSGRDEAENALRLAVVECEKQKTECEVQNKRVDHFEKLMYEQKAKFDECHEDRESLRAEFDKVAEAAGTPCAKRESIAPLVAEHREIRRKYRDAYYFLLHEFDMPDRDEGYDTNHFHNALDSLFGILADDGPYKEHDAHLRFGLRIPNVVARYANTRCTEREYFLLLCHRLKLDPEAPYRLHDFERAFDKYYEEAIEAKAVSIYENMSNLHKKGFWSRLKHFFKSEK